MNARQLFVQWFIESWKAFDQLLNPLFLGLLTAIWAAVTGRKASPCYADETLSAHAWRAEQRDKLAGKFFRPIIDVLFCWQSEEIEDDKGRVIWVNSHCERAYLKEKWRRGVPPEYRDKRAGSLQA